jgi:nucleoside-diphosphate-sugar epimerase
MSTRYTVLGATGFIGSRLIAALEQGGMPAQAPERGSDLIWQGNLGHLVYCIGLTADFRTRPFDTLRAHVGYLADVLERAQFASFTYLSSTRVYAGASSADEHTELLVNPLRPDDLYNVSKLAGETLTLRSGGEHARVVRLSNVYGDGAGANTFLSEIVESALRDGRVVLRDHLDSAKDYVHVEDVVGVLPRIAREGREPIYNVASGVNVSNRDLLEVLQRETGCQIETSPEADVIGFPPVETGRICREFGFRTRSVLAELPKIIRAVRA